MIDNHFNGASNMLSRVSHFADCSFVLELRHEWFDRMRGARTLMRSLHAAIRAHDLDTVVTLVTADDSKVDINFEYNGKTCLQVSLEEGNFEIAKVIILLLCVGVCVTYSQS